ncbi:transmembrane protein 119b [Stigmatopora argus]
MNTRLSHPPEASARPDVSGASDFPARVADFLREHALPVLLAACLLLVVALAFCGAIYLTRRRRAVAYYPSSYPAKMYVDRQDKKGGTGGFRQVPDRQPAAPGAATGVGHPEGQPVDSNKQLQADIVRMAQSLKTTPGGPAEDAAGRVGEAPPPKTVREPRGGNLRPSSLHLHNDSATLQLIAGEKTAF